MCSIRVQIRDFVVRMRTNGGRAYMYMWLRRAVRVIGAHKMEAFLKGGSLRSKGNQDRPSTSKAATKEDKRPIPWVEK